MRCLSLANVLRARGAEVWFACAALTASLASILGDEGHRLMQPSDLARQTWDWLVVDHYALDEHFESSMRRAATNILVIDDLANRRHECDVLVDQNLYEGMNERYIGLVPPHAKTLVGPAYTLLREEFARSRSIVHREGPIRTLLVCFGGSDPTDETTKVLEALRKCARAGLRVKVLTGPASKRRTELQALAEQIPGVDLVNRNDSVASLMLQADLAIGGGGSMTWERCCLGLPALVVAVAPNQVEGARTLHNRGYLKYLGAAQDVSIELIASEIEAARSRFGEIVSMGLRGMQLVDGLGASRVAAILLQATGHGASK